MICPFASIFFFFFFSNHWLIDFFFLRAQSPVPMSQSLSLRIEGTSYVRMRSMYARARWDMPVLRSSTKRFVLSGISGGLF